MRVFLIGLKERVKERLKGFFIILLRVEGRREIGENDG